MSPDVSDVGFQESRRRHSCIGVSPHLPPAHLPPARLSSAHLPPAQLVAARIKLADLQSAFLAIALKKQARGDVAAIGRSTHLSKFHELD
ncbi:hypothetical protein Pla52o_33950 [Novipirellula galeiformis]|uniref:Uncharacterized protein n=1 Tax=Novipirellula galeiformis TaxID=2528004 RepID=A0A5C6CHW8_9BACT|nr:hypothetical protein Pla52o_33950 [Novipirellula galeiformis]